MLGQAVCEAVKGNHWDRHGMRWPAKGLEIGSVNLQMEFKIGIEKSIVF
jgi:hypothetical protein